MGDDLATRKFTHRSRDGSGGEQIPGSHVAPGHCVVRQLLLHRPVPGAGKVKDSILIKGTLHVFEVGLGHGAPLSVLGVDFDIKLDVEREGIGMAEVGERCGILFIVWHRKWLVKKSK